MRDIPISATVSFYSLLSCPRPICNLCYLPGPVGIWVCDPYPRIRASSRQRPRHVREEQQFIQPIPDPATDSMYTNITIHSPAAEPTPEEQPQILRWYQAHSSLEKGVGKRRWLLSLWGWPVQTASQHQLSLQSSTEPHNRTSYPGKLRHMNHFPILSLGEKILSLEVKKKSACNGIWFSSFYFALAKLT